jgi:hypothetical protein
MNRRELIAGLGSAAAWPLAERPPTSIAFSVAGGPAGSIADQICDGSQRQDRQGARPRCAAVDPTACGRGDRVNCQSVQVRRSILIPFPHQNDLTM